MQALNWLHISDLHFNKTNGWRDNAHREALLDHLQELFKASPNLKPDMLMCTGDIAFGTKSVDTMSDQYEKAKVFFDQLRAVCGSDDIPLPVERVFAVPGNHDVDRGAINADAQRTLTDWATNSEKHISLINSRIDAKAPEYIDSMRRLTQYAEFIKKVLPHQIDEDGRCCYARVINVKGMKIGIAGFNTSWSCAGDEDDRNIWMGADWQFTNAKVALKDAEIRFCLMHHPYDWLNLADRNVCQTRLGHDFDFYLHGHTHDAWVTPNTSVITIAAGAVNADSASEFGVNIASINRATGSGEIHLFTLSPRSGGWTIAPVHKHAPFGRWPIKLPQRLAYLPEVTQENEPHSVRETIIQRYHDKKFRDAMQAFSGQPDVWVAPVLGKVDECTRDEKTAKEGDVLVLADLIREPRSLFIKAPPQHGLTCVARRLVVDAWNHRKDGIWLYLDSRLMKPNKASVTKAVDDELSETDSHFNQIKCVVVDSWSRADKDGAKLLRTVCSVFSNIPIICMERTDGNPVVQPISDLDRSFDLLYLQSLARENIREIVNAYNEKRGVADEDKLLKRLTSDLEVLNLHRTPLNCLTLLKVSEIDFNESPVNRCEIIKRLLLIIFSVTDKASYKIQPDAQDCEYVLGYFAENIIRDGQFTFTRDSFLVQVQKCCGEQLIDLDTHFLFDILVANNVLTPVGKFFGFKFAYWIFYFCAQRMHHKSDFAKYMFEDMRYAQHPEIMEFYTGIDRRKDDALEVLVKDLSDCYGVVKSACGFPDDLNPYKSARWESTEAAKNELKENVINGVMESNLPAQIKDQYADKHYNPSRPYSQGYNNILHGQSFDRMVLTMRAAARSLRNSDFSSPGHKEQLLSLLMSCWDLTTKVVMIIIPTLAQEGRAYYDGTSFVVIGKINGNLSEKMLNILLHVPENVVGWFQDDLFSPKMGPLLYKQLSNPNMSAISHHELILLLIRHRPRDWGKYIHKYMVEVQKNSFYLLDVFMALKYEYRFGYANSGTLHEIEGLIKMAAVKHVTGEKDPAIKTIRNTRFDENPVPPREVEDAPTR